MRQAGKMIGWKFLLYFFIGSIIGGVVFGIIGYFVTITRDGSVVIPVVLSAIFGLIFGGPFLASNIEKEK